VKRTLLLYSLCAAVLVGGCEQRKPVEKESKKIDEPMVKRENARLEFMTGEKDRFNPANNIESIRKKRPTKFGRSKVEPPYRTRTLDAMMKVINKPGYKTIAVEVTDTGSIEIPSYPFDYENDIRALKRLYEEHDLGTVINDDMKELEVARALTVYTYNFLKDGKAPSNETWMKDTSPSAETITRLRREKGIGGRSEHYAALLCQLSLSAGFVSRMVGMHTIGGNGEPLTHDVCEIYLNSYDKWAVFDPYSKATYYLRDGVPLNALEIRKLMLNRFYRDITPVIGVGDFTDVVSVREKLLPRYRYLYFWRINDILGKSSGRRPMSWQALFRYHLVWEDEYALVKDGGFERLEKFNNEDDPDFPLNGVRYVTHDESDFYWPVNQVALDLERIADDRLRVYIDSFTPNFDHFVTEVGVTQNNIRTERKTNVFETDMIPNDIIVRSYNKLGVPGPTAHVNLMLW